MKADVAGSGACTCSNSVILSKQTNLSVPKQRILPALVYFFLS